jgi:hypothetical protein
MQIIMQALIEADPASIRQILANVLANVCVCDSDPALLLEELYQMAARGIEAILSQPTRGTA